MVAQSAREFKKMGHDVTIYTFFYSPENCYEEIFKDLPVVSLGTQIPKGNYLMNFILENRNAKKLAQLIENDTEFLNPHDQASYRVAAYYKKRVKNIPSVWMMNDMPTKTWFYWREKQFDPDIKVSFFKKTLYRFVDQYDIWKFIKPQNGVMVLDSRDRDWVKEYFGKDADIVTNGSDAGDFSYLPRVSLRDKRARILMNGIFFNHRRFEDTLEAMKILESHRYDLTLSIVGDYNSDKRYYAKVLAKVRELGLEDRVKFFGRVSEKELVQSYYDHDIFVFPNHLQSWGIAPFEAMATGLPAIVSRGAGASEVLTHEHNAFLVNPLSPREIAEGVKKLIDDSLFYQKISANGRSFAEKNISWKRYADEMMEVFNRVYRPNKIYDSKKTILVSMFSNVVRGNFDHPGGVLDLLADESKKRGMRLVLITEKTYYPRFKPYEEKGAIVEIAASEMPKGFKEKFFHFFYSYLIFTGTTKMLATFGARADLPPAGGNRRMAFAKSFIASTFGALPFFKSAVIPRVFRMVFCREPYKNIFDKYNPDLVFVPNIALFPDLWILAEAKKRNIKTIGMACNWDHLNKYFIPLRSDFLLVQNTPMLKEAVDLQAYDENQVVPVGFSQFDHQLKFLESPTPKEEFLNKFGIPKGSRLILFISGSAYSLDEPDIIRAISGWIKEGKFGKNARLMLRPYVITRDKEREEEKYKEFLNDPDIVVNWLRRDKNMENRAYYMSMLYYADVIIPIFSTMAIEAAIFDKPTVTIGFDGHKKRPFHQSITRLEHMNHFKHVLNTGGVRVARSFPELFEALKHYLENPSTDKQKRCELTEKMCYKLDGRASQRIVNFIFNRLDAA